MNFARRAVNKMNDLVSKFVLRFLVMSLYSGSLASEPSHQGMGVKMLSFVWNPQLTCLSSSPRSFTVIPEPRKNVQDRIHFGKGRSCFKTCSTCKRALLIGEQSNGENGIRLPPGLSIRQIPSRFNSLNTPRVMSCLLSDHFSMSNTPYFHCPPLENLNSIL